jgi:hypothetical protein
MRKQISTIRHESEEVNGSVIEKGKGGIWLADGRKLRVIEVPISAGEQTDLARLAKIMEFLRRNMTNDCIPRMWHENAHMLLQVTT